jgi:hypothetical protein
VGRCSLVAWDHELTSRTCSAFTPQLSLPFLLLAHDEREGEHRSRVHDEISISLHPGETYAYVSFIFSTVPVVYVPLLTLVYSPAFHSCFKSATDRPKGFKSHVGMEGYSPRFVCSLISERQESSNSRFPPSHAFAGSATSWSLIVPECGTHSVFGTREPTRTPMYTSSLTLVIPQLILRVYGSSTFPTVRG